MYEIKLIDDFEEKEYHLSSIGMDNLHLVFEFDQTYIYAEDTNFYMELADYSLPTITRDNLTYLFDGDLYVLITEEQIKLVKDILDEEKLARAESTGDIQK